MTTETKALIWLVIIPGLPVLAWQLFVEVMTR